ncbi:MAG: 16S rRNA (cytosine(1402)-N(4))-methyltransferase [Candidatus Zambryskibacteria bacterium RIFCSPLOWO2_02_FULL_39_26]|uniref:Ribosomal RNA small subunit methyltransferase H n=1 Tax=Candidatus Zambryskibacteria bacterium RIFCSPLOWO2_12_FULL_39_23 TaxID=1802776 RepID=A0A1G2UT79_9BACT|nr:MAG: 16S rRNA (cytosine(1402)-N(4))-methyltransferase [Candidatus Zambryskibacteria bacterium RIFCSPHIGHO2_02_39_10]OHA99855.1 MAG: 16S rRNA (cytosine(1402)-N(4))-methyltransferase [Candidatus Zambryskibacteria bacterium RIFCSPHIGHO2_12_FULL_39_47]OHB10260.1 MAG: 16S rRNA (cytosine(1402)-N(4))-methyltransferase [Candidatus Zambryskibacteria bacterium RIFCSPLOWO2_02_FULL_39_26]OHB12599.1 MAG: 16S rRNA (cytosine(1402)-N(4))-methyltransferase [Candidatus Zambryskibacteria bacterium RIFCSPLOWO2_1
MNFMTHIPVLLHEVIDGLALKPGDIFVDGTLGGGGHSEEVLKRFGNRVKIIGIDLDSDAVRRSEERLGQSQGDIKFIEGSFRNLNAILDSLNIKGVDKILLDLGLSSNQFEESGRGFSFQKNEPLIMSFKKDLKEADLTAKEILNTWDLENIITIIKSYGEEKFAWKIAKAIVERREVKPIETTFDLVEIIKSATPKFYHHRKIHPTTKTFQALRITVNDEIESLKEGIRKGFERLNNGGRLAVISFHSLEDRVVKQFFKEKGTEGQAKILTKRPIIPSDEEIGQNPRSRSSKLRIIEKT